MPAVTTSAKPSRPSASNKNSDSVPFTTPMRRWRVFSVPAFFLFWTVVIVLRLFTVQIIEHHKYVEEAASQQERTFQVDPRRGIIYDRDLHGLAMTVYAESAYAVPWQVAADKAQDAKLLAAIVHTNPEDRYTTAHDILARMKASRDFAWVARKMDPGVYQRVKALHLKGIYFQREYKRYYPDQDLAAQLLGFVGASGNGLGGLEYEFNKQLRGEPGRMYTAVDARRHVLGSQERDPKPGENLVLTIDSNIQYMAEKALDENMARTKAKRGVIIVQDPHTGQILALAVRPSFNPNHYRYDNPDRLVDYAVSDVFEPGSMFKIVTYSGALQQHLITPDSLIHTLGGTINVHGRIVHDDRDVIRFEHQHGNVLNVKQALAQSSNVAAIEIGERLGKYDLYHYIREFGFGRRSGIQLPGETAGLLRPPDRWGPTAIGSVPMGYAVGITPIQLVTMASTVANGGIYLPPHIVMDVTAKSPGGGLQRDAFHPETDVPNPLPPGAHRVISELTAAKMRELMEGVVENGTGIPAQLNGYSAGGKTGTAEKIDPRTHTYSKRLYVASFVGFAPVNNPAVTIAVITDAPEYKYRFGTSASAPVFRELAQEILEYLGVPHDQPVKTPKEIAAELKRAPKESDPQEQIVDMDSLFTQINHLPANDPLRSSNLPGVAPIVDQRVAEAEATAESSPARSSAQPSRVTIPVHNPAQQSSAVAPAQTPAQNAVTVRSGPMVTVPSFVGESVRDVIEKAGATGLGVQVLGSGLATEQVPAAGARVPQGTQVVVRFHP